MRNQRKKVWIDRFQTYISVRMAAYFLLYQAAVVAIYFIWGRISLHLENLLGPQVASFGSFATVFILAVLGALFILDALRTTHRLVGPMYRFRSVLAAIKAGEEIPLIQLRHGDYLQDFKDEFNEVLEVLEEKGVVRLVRPQPKEGAKELASV